MKFQNLFLRKFAFIEKSAVLQKFYAMKIWSHVVHLLYILLFIAVT